MSSSAMRELMPGRNEQFRIDADDRLLAHAMMAFEQLGSEATSDAAADEAARVADGDTEQMLVVRARSLSNSRALADALRHVRQTVGLLVVGFVIVAIVGGAVAARAALGTPRNEPVNFFLVLAALLGLQTLLLLIWLCVMIFARRSAAVTMAAASLGGLVLALARRLIQWTTRGHGREHAAAISTVSAMLMRGSLGKWTLSAISNGLWLAFNVGCLAMIVALLSARQYTFAWETTILSSSAYVPLTNAVAALPRLAGFAAPSDHQIESSQWKAEGSPFVQTPDASQAWSALLVGSLVGYGLAPRLLLLALSLGQRRVARRLFRLDVNQPEALRILERLAPASSNLGVIDADEGAARRRVPVDHVRSSSALQSGPPAILAFEIDRPQTPWPPRIADVQWRDLGFVDGRDDRRRILDQLRRESAQPRALVIACGLANTPDRGAESFLREIASVAPAPIVMLLTGGHQLRQRSDADGLARRIDDWRTIGASAGISRDRVIELDLDHLTQDSMTRLAAIVCGSASSRPIHQRHIELAFDLILAFARRIEGQSGHASETDRLALHREIATLYRPQQESWQDLLHVPRSISAGLAQQVKGSVPGDFTAALQSSAKRFTQFLPDRLKRSPKWLASGAAAGALGCVAAAALISPVAIGALPLWTAIGAAIAAVVQPATRTSAANDPAWMPNSLDDAVRAAALFALVLELQGRDEVAITRILDATIPADDRALMGGVPEALAWLEDIRHRLDMALAREIAL